MDRKRKREKTWRVRNAHESARGNVCTRRIHVYKIVHTYVRFVRRFFRSDHDVSSETRGPFECKGLRKARDALPADKRYCGEGPAEETALRLLKKRAPAIFLVSRRADRSACVYLSTRARLYVEICLVEDELLVKSHFPKVTRNDYSFDMRYDPICAGSRSSRAILLLLRCVIRELCVFTDEKNYNQIYNSHKIFIYYILYEKLF